LASISRPAFILSAILAYNRIGLGQGDS
jgi:hypothetical protein